MLIARAAIKDYVLILTDPVCHFLRGIITTSIIMLFSFRQRKTLPLD
jgi:hypothetical protein